MNKTSILIVNGVFRSKSDKVFYKLQGLKKFHYDHTSRSIELDETVTYAVSMKQLNFLLSLKIGWDRVNHEDYFGVILEIEENAFSTTYGGSVTYYPKVISIEEVTEEVAEDSVPYVEHNSYSDKVSQGGFSEEDVREFLNDPFEGEYSRR